MSAKLSVVFYEEGTKKNDTGVPQGPSVVAFRSITRSSLAGSHRQVESVVHEEVPYPTKDLNEFANSCKQKHEEYAWKWILRVWGNRGRNKKLDQTKLIDMGPLIRNPRLNLKACTVKKRGVRSLLEWLVGVFVKRWPPKKELEVPDSL